MLPRLDKLAENCAEYLKSHKRWLNYFTFWKQGGKDHTAEQLATEMEGIIEELGNSDQNLVLNKLMDYPVIGGYNQLNANLNGKIGLAFGIFSRSDFRSICLLHTSVNYYAMIYK